VAVVEQVVGEIETRRPEPHDQDLVAALGLGDRPSEVKRRPTGQQAVDLEAPGQRQNVLEGARLDLGDVDRILLLVDAGLHAVVADPVPGRRQEGIVEGGGDQRAQRVALALEKVHLGDLLLQRAADQRCPEGIAAKGRATLLMQALGAGIAPLVMAPDAVVSLAQGIAQPHAGVGQLEALAVAQTLFR
jgi:hypothetical protein